MPKKKHKRDWRLIVLCVLVAALTLAVCSCAYQVGYFVGGKTGYDAGAKAKLEEMRKQMMQRCEAVGEELVCR